MSRSGIVNVRMVITEEKILSNIAKVQRLIDPNSKKQIVQLEEDSYFKDLIESIKTYLIEYPKKKNFPASVYKAAYGLVEFATNEFEENTKQIEELIRQREKNISLAGELKDVLSIVLNKESDWKEAIKDVSQDFSEDILDTLGVLGRAKSDRSQNYQDALKLINARIANLESNLHIEIDMERIEDRSKALSYIGIEVADALKLIPTPQEISEPEQVKEEQVVVEPQASKKKQAAAIKEKQYEEQPSVADSNYYESTRVNVKPSLWQRFKQSKFVRTIKYIMKIRIVLDVPALPSADDERK